MEAELLRRLHALYNIEDNDVVYIDLDGGTYAFKIDGAAESKFMLSIHSLYDFGWRITTSVVSDLLVKFAKPSYYISSITARTVEEVEEVVRGITDAVSYYGGSYVGGDVNEGGEVVVDVACIGRARARIGRKPAIGHVLVTLPEFGYTGLVFQLLGKLDEYVGDPLVERGISWLKRPTIDVNLIESVDPACTSASMDSSDGLAKVLWTFAERSNATVVVETLPAPREILEFADIDVLAAVFNGGEEYLPVLAVDPKCYRGNLTEFARVIPGPPVVVFKGEVLKYRGFDYFSTSP